MKKIIFSLSLLPMLLATYTHKSFAEQKLQNEDHKPSVALNAHPVQAAMSNAGVVQDKVVLDRKVVEDLMNTLTGLTQASSAAFNALCEFEGDDLNTRVNNLIRIRRSNLNAYEQLLLTRLEQESELKGTRDERNKLQVQLAAMISERDMLQQQLRQAINERDSLKQEGKPISSKPGYEWVLVENGLIEAIPGMLRKNEEIFRKSMEELFSQQRNNKS